MIKLQWRFQNADGHKVLGHKQKLQLDVPDMQRISISFDEA